MTYRDIAKRAGVSVATVSRVMNGNGNVNSDKAELILKLVADNGIKRPKYRHLQQPLRIAILVPDIISASYSRAVTLLMQELQKSGIEPSIYLTDYNNEKYSRIINLLCDLEKPDGIITLDKYRYPYQINIPIATLREVMTSPAKDHFIDTVVINSENYYYDALLHLISLGHKRIGFIGEKYTEVKNNTFISAAALLKLSVDQRDIFTNNEHCKKIGARAAEYFMSQPSMPTALIAAYNEMAIDAINTFADKGIKVPEDISIIGTNNIPFSANSEIQLTTVDTYSVESIHLVIKLLLDHIKNPDKHMIQHIKVNGKLIIRDTTGPAQSRRSLS